MGGCKWNPAWAKTFPWAKPVEGKPGRVFCSLCASNFSCDKGKSVLTYHDKQPKHSNLALNAAQEQAQPGAVLKQQSIEAGLRTSEAAAVKQRKIKDQARVAEAKLATLIATHDMPLKLMDCLAELLPKIITDSEIVKEMSLHQNKARYVLRFSVAKTVKEKILKQMREWPFSLNFDVWGYKLKYMYICCSVI